MSRTNVLTRRLGLRHPVIQAPMAGGGDTPALVAAVCDAGALGFVGASYLTPLQIVETVRAVRGQTTRPFGINLLRRSRPQKHQSSLGWLSSASSHSMQSSRCRVQKSRRSS